MKKINLLDFLEKYNVEIPKKLAYPKAKSIPDNFDSAKYNRKIARIKGYNAAINKWTNLEIRLVNQPNEELSIVLLREVSDYLKYFDTGTSDIPKKIEDFLSKDKNSKEKI